MTHPQPNTLAIVLRNFFSEHLPFSRGLLSANPFYG